MKVTTQMAITNVCFGQEHALKMEREHTELHISKKRKRSTWCATLEVLDDVHPELQVFR